MLLPMKIKIMHVHTCLLLFLQDTYHRTGCIFWLFGHIPNMLKVSWNLPLLIVHHSKPLQCLAHAFPVLQAPVLPVLPDQNDNKVIHQVSQVNQEQQQGMLPSNIVWVIFSDNMCLTILLSPYQALEHQERNWTFSIIFCFIRLLISSCSWQSKLITKVTVFPRRQCFSRIASH